MRKYVPLAEPFFNGTGLMTQVQLYSRFHAWDDAANRGVPVPGTGVRHYRKSVNGAGVSANSRILPHRYADEGEKGKAHRKQIRHAEEMMWRADWVDEGYDVEEASTVAQWFYDNSDDVDSDIIPDVYTVGETVVEWPNYGYAYSSYDYYADYDSYTYYPNAYDREMMGEYPEYECELCCGPCVMD